MRVLITGGAGFIGSHTADMLLAAGHQVRILDLLDPQIHGCSETFPDYLDRRIECRRGDVRNLETVQSALDEIDAVFHFAAETGVGQSMYDLQSYVDTNCVGTATVLEAIIKSKRRLNRFVLASSRAVYGEGSYCCAQHGTVHPPVRPREQLEAGDFSPHCPICSSLLDSVPTGEDTPPVPVSVYGWTKKHQEDLCLYAAETFQIPTVILRYFNVYGSRQSLKNPYTGVVTVFYNRILAGKPAFLYERGSPIRDFVHVNDVARANLLALDAAIRTHAVINIGSGQSVTIADIANTLANTMGRDAAFVSNTEFRVGDIFACVANLERANRLLGYEPRTSLDAGMKEFALWAHTQHATDEYDVTVEQLTRHGLFGRMKER